MSAQDKVDLLNGYNQWASNKRLGHADTSPERYLEERAQETAFERLEGVRQLLRDRLISGAGLSDASLVHYIDTGLLPLDDDETDGVVDAELVDDNGGPE